MLQQASRNVCVLKVSAALMVNISGRIHLCSGEHRKKALSSRRLGWVTQSDRQCLFWKANNAV